MNGIFIHRDTCMNVKDSSDPIHFIFEINVGKSRIRHTTTPKKEKSIEDGVIEIQSRFMSDTTLSDVNF